MKKIIIISNDKIFLDRNQLSSNYNDTINILDSLNKRYQVYLISRESKIKQNFSLIPKKKNEKIKSFHINHFKKNENLKILVISVTPRNLVNYLSLNFFFKKISGYVYLRSDGYKEYEKKFSIFGKFFYGIFLRLVINKLKVIAVSRNIECPKQKEIIIPSELDDDWFKNIKKVDHIYPKLLYLGRYKIEKGVYSLINLIHKINFKHELTIAGDSKKIGFNSKNIKYLSEITKKKEVIKLYDDHNIFILPSYTEGSPKVILESLARKRPVIVFKEIKHVKSNLYGVFFCERDVDSLKNTINFILKNYKQIQKKMNKNNLPTKIKFQKKLIDILDG